MAIHSLVKRAAVVTASAAIAATTLAGTASANTQAGYVGDNQANDWTAVQCVQHDFNQFSLARGGNYPSLKEDGYWGPNTRSAVIWMQNMLISYAKHADGIVGPLTGDLLLDYGDQGWDGKCRAALPTSS
ncbi:hypothetical protein P3T27_005567 [Kitasatospora sp. MAA19]|uniref:peptidoglycan-binding domain-containing protein n=1 Tax=Kitasatospora sp. MAA19 TaxID=3035090 RepID=UPI002474C43E|nr:peptidoglycan-binding domain-containing protein [Kitasatospora sp. MAA19]MDH6708821.1 hypothetical protein [Kitasatospora sp. MAA19]